MITNEIIFTSNFENLTYLLFWIEAILFCKEVDTRSLIKIHIPGRVLLVEYDVVAKTWSLQD